MDRPGVRQVPEGSGEQGKMEKTGCKIICGAPTTLAVKGLMMMLVKKTTKICVYFYFGTIACMRNYNAVDTFLNTSRLGKSRLKKKHPKTI